MDLGIRGRTAIVCAASKGLGRACARALAREGVDVTITARGKDALAQTADEIRKEFGVRVTAVEGDIATEAGRTAALAACPEPDILINNAGGPPVGAFRDWRRDDWLKTIDANMLAPIEMIRLTVDAMIARRFGRIVNITSYSVKVPVADLSLSNGARAGLTGFVAGVARDVALHNVTINNLLPGPFETDRMVINTAKRAAAAGKTPQQMRAEAEAQSPARRWGAASEFGDACAFLCSAQAGYIVGQNLVVDGGIARTLM
ncbi:MAG: SDR family oxidoreductase [Alphaproteobacteria bacterium]